MNVALLDLFDRQILPHCCAGCSRDYASTVRGALRLWGAVLGRAATTDDLTDDRVQHFGCYLRHAGYGTTRIRTLQTRLRTVWRYAHRLGLAARCERAKPVETLNLNLPSAVVPKTPPRVFSISAGRPLAGTLANYFEATFAPQELCGLAASTVSEYRAALRSVERHYPALRLEQLDDALAAAHFQWMRDQGKTPWAVNNVRKYWFAVWRHAKAGGHVAALPSIKRIKTGRSRPDAWTLDETARIVAAASPWWRALLLVGWWTLLRRRSLFEIEPADVDYAAGWIDLPPSALKNGVAKRVRVGRDALDALGAISGPPRRRVFEWRHNPKRLDSEFRSLLAAAGVAPSRRRNLNLFHKLRRTAATHAAIRSGLAVVCDLLGHSERYVTERYIDTSLLPGHDATAILPSLTDGTLA